MAAVAAGAEAYPGHDRAKELKEFDQTKAGVKGLVESGVARIPRIFVNGPEDRPRPSSGAPTALQVPAIDLRGHGRCLSTEGNRRGGRRCFKDMGILSGGEPWDPSWCLGRRA